MELGYADRGGVLWFVLMYDLILLCGIPRLVLDPEEDRWRASPGRGISHRAGGWSEQDKGVNYSTSTLPLDRSVPMSYTGLAFRLQWSAQLILLSYTELGVFTS